MEKPQLKKIEEFFTKEGNVIAAYLFGSHAVGTSREDSDVDIAVLFEQMPDNALDYRIEKSMELERILKKEVDLIIMNNSPLILQFQVIKEGQILYEMDADKRATYQMHFLSRYYDYIKFFDYHSKYLCNEIKERGLGIGYTGNRS